MSAPAQPAPPRLFDRTLRRARQARGAADFPAHDFLHRHAAGLVEDRLLDVARSFERACLWGDRARAIGAGLPAGKLGEVVRVGRDIVADTENNPFADGAFDLVVSLLDLHAVNDPVGALIQINRSLRPDGLFIGVMFGADTLEELRTSMAEAEIAVTGGLSPRIFPFADVRDAGALLQRAGFALPVAEADRLTVRYADPLRLLRDLRGAGEGNVLTGRRRAPMSRALLGEAMVFYAGRHADADGRLRATFSFTTLTGWRPHESQQKPLRPGSGAVSLAEALKPSGGY